MSLLVAADQAGILDRAIEICAVSTGAMQQIRTGAEEIRSYRIWYLRRRGQ